MKRGKETTLYMEPEVLEKLDEYAEGEERSRSWMVNHVLREAMGIPRPVQSKQMKG